MVELRKCVLLMLDNVFCRYGLECVFRFYSYGLEKKFRTDLFQDFQEAVKQDYNEGKGIKPGHSSFLK